MSEILVSISCITYNHAPYIRECLDGFLMQKTSFGIEVLIHDDASNDGTIEIINEYEKKYPEIIKPIIQKENQFSQGKRGLNAKYNFSRAKGKYIALCEGDDYWTDPLKLQKQVDFLEANEDFSICFHNIKIKREDENKIVDDNITPSVSDITDIYRLAEGNYLHTPSVVFRKNQTVFDELLTLNNLVAGDYVLHMLNAKYGKIMKLSDTMAVYRIHKGGIWSRKSIEFTYPIWLDLIEKIIPLFSFEIQKILFNQYMILSKEIVSNLIIDLESDRNKLHKIRNSIVFRFLKTISKPFSVFRKTK